MPKFSAKLTAFTFDQKGYSKAFNTALLGIYRKAARAFLRAALPRVPFRTGFVRGAFTVLSEAVGGNVGGSGIGQFNSLVKLKERIAKLSERVRKLRAKGPSPRLEQARRRLIRVQGQFFKKLRKVKKDVRFTLGALGAASRAKGELNPADLERRQPTAAKGKEKRRTRSVEFGPGGERTEREVTERVGRPRVEFYRPPEGGKVLKTLRSGRDFASLTLGGSATSKRASQFEGFTAPDVVEPTYNFSFRIDISYFNINDAFSNSRTPSSPWRSFEFGRLAFLQVLKDGLKKLPDVVRFIREVEYEVGSTVKKTERKQVVQSPTEYESEI